MLLWSYFSVVFIDPGSVPPNWRPTIDEEIGEEDPLVGAEFMNAVSDPSNQRIRYCRKCNQLKPPRCHHCSVCEFFPHKHCHFSSPHCEQDNIILILFGLISGGRCVLKMDHHCVWVVNCVGALNYKYFLLFLVWTLNLSFFFVIQLLLV